MKRVLAVLAVFFSLTMYATDVYLVEMRSESEDALQLKFESEDDVIFHLDDVMLQPTDLWKIVCVGEETIELESSEGVEPGKITDLCEYRGGGK